MFGKRVIKKDEPKKVKKEVYNDSRNAKKSVDKNDNINSSDNNINNNDNTSDISVKPKKTYSFMKKTGSKSSGLLFGKTKEEKLKQFVKNIKIIHPNMPDFWVQKDIEKFKKKFNIENDK